MRAGWLALAAVLFVAAGFTPRLLRGTRSRPPELPVTRAVEVAAEHPPGVPEFDVCERERERLASLAPLAGAPRLEAHRAELLARAKAEPVIFLSAPADTPRSKRAAALRRRLHTDQSPWAAFEAAYRGLSSRPEELREVLLTDGYLYAEDPTVGAMLATHVTLGQLFREPELLVYRGEAIQRALKRADDYVWAEGPDKDQVARLWLFDRVAPAGVTLPPPRHLVVTELSRRLGTTQIEVERLTAEGVLARLHYGDQAVPAVLRVNGGKLELGCQIDAGLGPRLAAARATAEREQRVLSALRRVVEQQIEEGLPFDEPKTEDGQQDGKLRAEWRRAYLRGDVEYQFNEDTYWVFDRKGRPHVPQVCVDFVLDSWERMADSWWLPRADKRARRVGRLDFDALQIENRRSVEQLIGFAKQHPDWFELLEVPYSAQVPLRGRRRFFERLYRDRREYRPGDVVVILGPRDDGKLHYHSFFVVSADPISGMPTWLAANAGRPRVRTWEGEMQNAPERAIVARVRPRLEWLERLVGTDAVLPP
jgi:hypothetical protein